MSAYLTLIFQTDSGTGGWVESLTWAGIALCLLHSAMFSGLNLALFSLSRMHLEIEAEGGNKSASRVLDLRADANFLLTTILWGNVAVNTLLTLLMDSVMVGVAAFAVSTFGITFIGEIIPQAYFSRHSLKMGSLLAPVIRFYQKVLWPFARPSAKLLDWWLGRDGIHYLRESHLRAVIEKHVHSKDADLEHREGVGALNFLALDDLPAIEEGEPLDPLSIVTLPMNVDLPVIPEFKAEAGDPFVRSVAASGRKWVVLVDEDEAPRLVMNADSFLRDVLDGAPDQSPYFFCHRPIVITDPTLPLGKILRSLRVDGEHAEDDVIDEDIILLWGADPENRRVITGADLLGRMLRGITAASPPGTVSKRKITRKEA